MESSVFEMYMKELLLTVCCICSSKHEVTIKALACQTGFGGVFLNLENITIES